MIIIINKLKSTKKSGKLSDIINMSKKTKIKSYNYVILFLNSDGELLEKNIHRLKKYYFCVHF